MLALFCYNFHLEMPLFCLLAYTCFIFIQWFLRFAGQVSQIASHLSSDEMNCTRVGHQHGLTCWHLRLTFWLYLTRISVLICRLVDFFFEKKFNHYIYISLQLLVEYNMSMNLRVKILFACSVILSKWAASDDQNMWQKKLCSSQGYALNIFLDHFLGLFSEK